MRPGPRDGGAGGTDGPGAGGTIGAPVFAVVVVVIVVGSCIAVVTWVLTRSMEPATSRPDPPREPSVRSERIAVRTDPGIELWDDDASEPDVAGELVGPARLWQRARSAVLLALVAVLLGFFAALAVGVAVIALFGLLRSSVG